MTEIERYNNIFIDIFNTKPEQLNVDFNKDNISEWDSVHQLSLAGALEEEFDILLEPEEIMGMTSYEIGKTILRGYQINI